MLFARKYDKIYLINTLKGKTMENKNYCIIYNPLSGNGRGKTEAEALAQKINAAECADMTAISDYAEFFAAHSDSHIVICGGDGTLNRFLNDTKDINVPDAISYCAGGSGNDFLRDIEGQAGEVIALDKYIEKLPVCTVKGKDYKFINGIGYGIDGYCCEVGDKLRAESDKPINYTGIAIKGLLFHYKPTAATVTVDGVKQTFKKVWIAPTMLGRYYGGGMMPTPKQDRLNGDGTVSVMIFHGTGKLHTLMIFPSLFKGEHVKHEKHITILSGKEITVEFDSPRAAQVDGETVLGVSGYTVRAYSEAKVKAEEAASV